MLLIGNILQSMSITSIVQTFFSLIFHLLMPNYHCLSLGAIPEIGSRAGFVQKTTAGSFDNEALGVLFLLLTFACFLIALRKGRILP